MFGKRREQSEMLFKPISEIVDSTSRKTSIVTLWITRYTLKQNTR